MDVSECGPSQTLETSGDSRGVLLVHVQDCIELILRTNIKVKNQVEDNVERFCLGRPDGISIPKPEKSLALVKVLPTCLRLRFWLF